MILHKHLDVRINDDGSVRFKVNKRASGGAYDAWIDVPRHEVARLRKALNDMPTAQADQITWPAS